MALADYIPESSRKRIKGTDPKVKAVTDRIGRGTRDVQAEQRGRGGLSDMAESQAQDDFARRLSEGSTPSEVRTDEAYKRFQANKPAPRGPSTRRKYVHETDIGNVESIRKSGIRPSRGGSAMGTEGVYAFEGGSEGDVPEGRARIEFEADAGRVRGRGTAPGSRTVALQGAVDPADITAGYGPSGRIFDAGSTLGLLGMLASFVPGVANRFPWASSGGLAGDALSYTIGQNYAPGGIMDPYKDMRDMAGFNPATGTVAA